MRCVNQSRFLKQCCRKEVLGFLTPPAGSHIGGGGGVWEKQIRTVRKILYPPLQQQHCDDGNLQTLFRELEEIVNSRPITVTDDPKEVLTLSHLFRMKVHSSLLLGTFQKENMYSRN